MATLQRVRRLAPPDMTAEEALAFFTEKKTKAVLQAMNDVGLGYLRLGQPLSTVSGGEGQRLKLATELHKQGSVYVMDEPTTGLHLSDIGLLMGIIDRLVAAGNTVICPSKRKIDACTTGLPSRSATSLTR